MRRVAMRGNVTAGRRRRALAVCGALAAALAAPAVAQATTFTVAAGGGSCGGTDTSCESLVAAAGAAGSGDTVQVAPGVYDEAPTFTAPGVTITGSTTAPGVVITGTVSFSGSGGTPSVLEKVIVAPSSATSPAVGVSGSAGVAVRDAFLLSAGGSGMAISSGAGNEITRSTVVSGAPSGAAVDIQSGGASVGLVLSSSILSGGPSGNGLSVRTGVGTLLPGSAGAATITARHVTIAGSANGIALDASAAVGLLSAPAGSITATVTDSIVHGATPRSVNAGIPLVAAPNTATLSLTRTDQTTPDAQLFVSPARRNFHLRADAPVIDKGQVTPADSPTDVDGQPRENGAASDLGADEFVNGTPTASFAVTTPARSSRTTTFDASSSTDREGAFGGGITEYRWNFGDGATETTTTPTVNHVYKGEGAVAVQLVVVDRQGGASPPATAGVRVTDGTPPSVVITVPRPNRTFGLIATSTKTVTKGGVKRKVTTRRRARIGFGGRAKDPSGVAAVFITLQRLAKAGVGKGAKASADKKKKPKSCVWLDPKRGLIIRSCDKPILIKARVRDNDWAYIVGSKISLGAGTYRVSAYGTDGVGSFGNSAGKARRVVRFTLTG